jgi:hypothetical protein
MIVQFAEASSGVAIYVNPGFVVSMRPDPADPERTSEMRLSDGERIRVRGNHEDVAERLARTTMAA